MYTHPPPHPPTHTHTQEFDGEAFLECIKDLVRVDREWVPKAKDCSLYIRPTYIGTEVR